MTSPDERPDGFDLIRPLGSYQLIVEKEHTLSCPNDGLCVVEMFFGTCELRMNDISTRMSARQVLLLRHGESIQIRNPDGLPCKFIYIVFSLAESAALEEDSVLGRIYPAVAPLFQSTESPLIMPDDAQVYLSVGDIQNEFLKPARLSGLMLPPMVEILFLRLARCYIQPRRASGVHYLIRARAFISDHFRSELSNADIADYVGISKSYLEYLFRKYLKCSVVAYIQKTRCQTAAYMLATTSFSVIDIAVDSGFNSRQHFLRVFRNIYGMTPSEYRKCFER